MKYGCKQCKHKLDMNCELDLDEYILKFGQIHFAIQTNTNAVPRNEIWMQAVQALARHEL